MRTTDIVVRGGERTEKDMKRKNLIPHRGSEMGSAGQPVPSPHDPKQTTCPQGRRRACPKHRAGQSAADCRAHIAPLAGTYNGQELAGFMP